MLTCGIFHQVIAVHNITYKVLPLRPYHDAEEKGIRHSFSERPMGQQEQMRTETAPTLFLNYWCGLSLLSSTGTLFFKMTLMNYPSYRTAYQIFSAKRCGENLQEIWLRWPIPIET